MKTIVWDVDDVLNDLMLSWFEQEWLPAHPACKVSFKEITENPPFNILGITRSEYLLSLDSFRKSDKARSMKPNQEIMGWLRQSADRYRHLALTARPLDTVPPVAEWLFRFFGGYIRTFSVVPIRQDPTLPRIDENKRDFLFWLNKVDVFVDDNEDNVQAACSIGVMGILYPQRWNSSTLTVAETLDSVSRACTQ